MSTNGTMATTLVKISASTKFRTESSCRSTWTTTRRRPMDPRVLEEMLPYFMEKFGNSASRNHPFGWAAEEAVELSRERIAKLIGATPKEIIFTSGATESDNLAIKGVAEMYREKGNHIITAVTEHKAVLDTCKHLEKYGFRVTYLAGPERRAGRSRRPEARDGRQDDSRHDHGGQ